MNLFAAPYVQAIAPQPPRVRSRPLPWSALRPPASRPQGLRPGRPLTGRWEPTRENGMLMIRKSYISVPETARSMAKTTTPKPGPKRRVKWLRYVLLGVVGFGVYHLLSGPSGALNVFKLRRTNTQLVEELDSLALRKQALEIEKQRLEKDSAYIERVARKELGMSKPDEKVFRFVPPASKNDD
jgi:cell division protein FtsB